MKEYMDPANRDKEDIQDAIGNLGDQAYGMNIQQHILEHAKRKLDLVTIFERLYDLIEDGRVRSERIFSDFNNSCRDLFTINRPGEVAFI